MGRVAPNMAPRSNITAPSRNEGKKERRCRRGRRKLAVRKEGVVSPMDLPPPPRRRPMLQSGSVIIRPLIQSLYCMT